MASENEKNAEAIFDLADAASNISYGIQNLLDQRFNSIEKEYYAVSDTVKDINNFVKDTVKKSELYKKLEYADEFIDPCFGAGFYLNQIIFNVKNANELWSSNGPWALAENAWNVSPEEMKKVLFKIKEDFDIFSHYAGKCAAKYKD